MRMRLAIAVEGYRRRILWVHSYQEASRVWTNFKKIANDGAGFGGSAMRQDCGQLYDGTKPVAYVAYNGRVFDGTPQEWTPATPVLYE